MNKNRFISLQYKINLLLVFKCADRAMYENKMEFKDRNGSYR